MGREEVINDLENSEAFKLLDDLANQPNKTVGDAVKQIIKLTITACADNPTEDAYGGIGGNVSLALLELTQRLDPTKHSKLVQFLSKLQKHKTTHPSTGEPLIADDCDFWTGLPSLGWTELEAWQEFGGEYTEPHMPELQGEQRQRWVNLNAFIAQITQAADVSYTSSDQGINLHPMDKSLHGIWTILYSLEEDEVPMQTLSDTAAMEATCMWFIYASNRLWENVLYGRTYTDSGSETVSEIFKPRGWRGFERDRWDVWEERLKAAREVCANERMGGLIDNALGHMRQAMAT